MSSGAAAGAAPVTMEEWARRQRALKEQERQKKNASAETLHKYRGGIKEEDTKLAALKEQDRKKKEETAEALRHYRGVGTLREEETMLAALKEQDRKKKEETAEALRQYRGAGALRDEDTKLAAIRQQDRQLKQDAQQLLHQYREKEIDIKAPTRPEQQRITPDAMCSGNTWNPEDVIAPGSVSNIAANFSYQTQLSNVSDNSNSSLPQVQPPAPLRSSKEAETSTPATPAQTAPTTTAPAVVSKAIPSTSTTTTTTAARSVPPPEEPQAPPPLKRLDIKFSFGIVSLADEPTLDGYMVAVKDIVERGMAADDNLSKIASLDPQLPPFVNEVDRDDGYKDQSGRNNVKRFLVKASVPIFIKPGSSSQTARRGVIAVLQEAIQSGALLTNAVVTKN